MNGYETILSNLALEQRLRELPADKTCRNDLIDLTSNDYLGLASSDLGEEREIWREISAPFTSSASRLLALQQEAYTLLENDLERLYGRPALLFNSGYHANVGILQALAIPGTAFVADKLVHASIIDGLRLSGREFVRVPHNNAAAFSRAIEKAEERDGVERIIVVVESVYSMDGDLAPLRELVELKRRHPKMMLYVDEAHGFGVWGKRGLGLAEHLGVLEDIDVIVGTFGKACASIGAFVVTSAMMKEYMVNCSRSLIFSTSLPPANIIWTRLMLKRLVTMGKERESLQLLSRRFATGMAAAARESGYTPLAGAEGHSSPIVPFVTGDSGKALQLSSRLRENGVLALPIRRPTVPPGTERIRFSLHHGLDPDIANKIREIIVKA